jgi:hypothetical protein
MYWNILTMHVDIKVKSPNNISEWQMGFNSAFKGLISNYDLPFHGTLSLVRTVYDKNAFTFSVIYTYVRTVKGK